MPIKNCAHCAGQFEPTCNAARYCSRACHLLGSFDQSGECWIWKAGRDKDGYGVVRFRGRVRLKAHRAAYEEFVGELPAGVMVCHSCDEPSCVNPKHLFIGDAQANKSDSVAKGRHAHGERAHKAKLTVDQARAVRRDARPSPIVASELGVTPEAIQAIRRGKSWKHIQ